MKRTIALMCAVSATLLVSCGGTEATPSSEPTPSPTPETFTAGGKLTLLGEGDDWDYGPCAGSGGYSDIAGGTQVVVYNAADERLAFSELREGKSETVGKFNKWDGYERVDCIFSFLVRDIPSGEAIYSIEVANRGKISFREEDATRLSLTLGD